MAMCPNNDDAEQMRLQQMLGGGGAVNQTQPVGAPQGWSGNQQADASLDTPWESQLRGDLMGLGMPSPRGGGGGGMADLFGGGGGGGTSMAARKALGGYGSTGTMSGFNTALDYPDDKAATSVKNTFGRIASKYKNAPSSIDAILADPEFQRHFPNARKVAGGAGDKIDFGGVLSDFESGVPVGVVDVLQSADPSSDSAAAWAWQDEANDGGGGGMGMGGGDPLAAILGGGGAGGPMSALDQLGNSDILARILEAITGAGEGNSDLTALFGGR